VQVTIYKDFRWCGGFDVFHQEILNIRILMINTGKNALMSSDKLHRALSKAKYCMMSSGGSKRGLNTCVQ
jgi:hypothetical protein